MLTDISNKVGIRRKQGGKPESSKKAKRGHQKKLSLSLHSDENAYSRKKSNARDSSSGQASIQQKPSYHFPEFFKKESEKLFPFVENLQKHSNSQTSSKDRVVNYVENGSGFPKNAIKKYSQTVKVVCDCEQTVAIDPAEALFNSTKNLDKTLPFNKSTLTVLVDGRFEIIQKAVKPRSQTAAAARGSKRSVEDSAEYDCSISSSLLRSANASLLSASGLSFSSPPGNNSAVSVKRLKSAFKTPVKKSRVNDLRKVRHSGADRLDNSRTISAKAILRMVDDSLVSSDTSMYSQSNLSQVNKSVGPKQPQSKKQVRIDADDLMRALTSDERLDRDCWGTPAQTKVRRA